MVRRIKPYPIKKLHGPFQLKIPVGAEVIGVASIESSEDVVHILVAEPVDKGAQLLELNLQIVSGTSPFQPGDGEELHYVGTAVWDNGYRINHVFIVDAEQEPLEVSAPPKPTAYSSEPEAAA